MSISTSTPIQIIPSKGLGFLTLGSSIYDVLTRLRSHHHTYPSISVIYKHDKPLSAPIVLLLDANGLRLRFDGADQRLRLIEVLDFQKYRLSYNNIELTKPTFRNIYNRSFGITYPGEYIKSQGVYVLSYPGVAFSFPVDKETWKEDAKGVEFISQLSAPNAQPASSMAIFTGSSWSEARNDLFSRAVQNPRSPIVNGTNARLSSANDEIELVKIHDENKIELVRRHNHPFWITLHSTTPQDLIAELGPPNAIYRKSDHRLSIHRTRSLSSHGGALKTQYDTDDTEADDVPSSENEDPVSDLSYISNSDYFYNYFNHGFDIFISSSRSSSHPVAAKLILHGNVPGSYEFQRYRRSRWRIELSPPPASDETKEELKLNSETTFDEALPMLQRRFGEGQRPMLLNRGSDSPSSSCELLGGWEDADNGEQKREKGQGLEGTFGDTELHGFPGFIFEVLKNQAISSLTVF